MVERKEEILRNANNHNNTGVSKALIDNSRAETYETYEQESEYFLKRALSLIEELKEKIKEKELFLQIYQEGLTKIKADTEKNQFIDYKIPNSFKRRLKSEQKAYERLIGERRKKGTSEERKEEIDEEISEIIAFIGKLIYDESNRLNKKKAPYGYWSGWVSEDVIVKWFDYYKKSLDMKISLIQEEVEEKIKSIENAYKKLKQNRPDKKNQIENDHPFARKYISRVLTAGGFDPKSLERLIMKHIDIIVMGVVGLLVPVTKDQNTKMRDVWENLISNFNHEIPSPIVPKIYIDNEINVIELAQKEWENIRWESPKPVNWTKKFQSFEKAFSKFKIKDPVMINELDDCKELVQTKKL